MRGRRVVLGIQGHGGRCIPASRCIPVSLPPDIGSLTCACAVRHSLVYRFCSEDGEWAPKNTGECEDDPAEVRGDGVASQLGGGGTGWTLITANYGRYKSTIYRAERQDDYGLSFVSIATVRSCSGAAADHVYGGLLTVPGRSPPGPGSPHCLQVRRGRMKKVSKTGP